MSKATAAARAALGTSSLGLLAPCAASAEWVKEKPLPVPYGSAETVETNSSRKIKLWIALMRLGAKTGCHQRNERSLFLKGYQFPVCARCTGLFFGQLFGLALFFLFTRVDIKLLLVCAAVSLALLGIDGLFQLKGIWVSTNPRRLITGLLCGFFVTCFNARVIVFIIQKIY
jgi:uncharacterized membrane protein